MNKAELKNAIVGILRKNDVAKAAFFGSYSQNTFHEDSDVDILISFKNNDKTLLDLIALKQELEEQTNKKFDVLTYNSLYPKLKDSILSEQEIIYG